MSIVYLEGDATQPQGKGRKIIAHVCNDAGGFGAGFAKALAERWPLVRSSYQEWYRRGATGNEVVDRGGINDGYATGFKLSQVQYLPVSKDVLVANMLCQHGYGRSPKLRLRYKHLMHCLNDLRVVCSRQNFSAHMPRIGAGLAGGDWKVIEQIIEDTLVGFPVYVYDLERR